MNAYEQTLKLLNEMRNLNRMAQTHVNEKPVFRSDSDRFAYSAQSRMIVLRLERTERELAILKREYFADFCRASRDFRYEPVGEILPITIEMDLSLETQPVSAGR